jgi:iron complex outermembrane receptor protein
MTKFFRSGSSLALAIAALSCGTAHAQTAETNTPKVTETPQPVAQDDSNPSNDIIVTATKRAESLSDVPMSITAISGAALQDKGINNVQDLVKITPGLSYVDSGLGTPVFSLRGVGFFETSIGARPTVSVYTDEAPLPFSVMAQGASFDLERVEILKGPQGTLFGQNSTGGAINYIAAKPQSTLGGGVTASVARFGTTDIQGYITGPISSTVNVRLAARTVHGGDWQKSYTRDATRGSQNLTQGRLLVDWQASEKLKISLNLNGFIDKGDTQAAQLIGILYVGPSRAGEVPLLGTYPKAPAAPRAADWDANPQTPYVRNNRMYQSVVRADYEVSDAITLTSLTSWSRIGINQNSDADGTALSSSDLAVVGKITSFSSEARLAGDHGKVRWIVGGSYAKEHIPRRGTRSHRSTITQRPIRSRRRISRRSLRSATSISISASSRCMADCATPRRISTIRGAPRSMMIRPAQRSLLCSTICESLADSQFCPCSQKVSASPWTRR